MKRLLRLILITLLVSISTAEVHAQVKLTIQSLYNYPDTAYNGLSIQPVIIVKNTGNVPFQGVVQIAVGLDSSTIQYLYSSNNVVSILPNDTVSFVGGPAGSTTYTFDSTFYRVGHNVVVVWPVSSAFVLVDTLHTNVYFTINQLQGIRENEEIKGLVAYPNPAIDYIQLYSPEISLEYVRVYDLSGRTILNHPVSDGNETRIPIDAIQPGIYIMEVESSKKTKSLLRFVKVN